MIARVCQGLFVFFLLSTIVYPYLKVGISPRDDNILTNSRHNFWVEQPEQLPWRQGSNEKQWRKALDLTVRILLDIRYRYLNFPDNFPSFREGGYMRRYIFPDGHKDNAVPQIGRGILAEPHSSLFNPACRRLAEKHLTSLFHTIPHNFPTSTIFAHT